MWRDSLPLEDQYEWARKSIMVVRPVMAPPYTSPLASSPPATSAAPATNAAAHAHAQDVEEELHHERAEAGSVEPRSGPPDLAALRSVYNHSKWMPDEETDVCLKCQREFTITIRRVRVTDQPCPSPKFKNKTKTKTNDSAALGSSSTTAATVV